MSDGMFIARETPWRNIGTVVSHALTSDEALKAAGLDWDVLQFPVVHNGQDSGYKMNVRSSDDKVLGVVGDKYKIVQNKEAFEFVESLLGEGVTFESAGNVASGKRIWLLAKMPETLILGDATEPYLCLTNGHDGFSSLKVAMTPIRVACQNMLNYALKKSSRMWTIRHTGSMEYRMQEARNTFIHANEYMGALEEQAETLYKIKVSDMAFERFQESMFPMTELMTERKLDAQKLQRAQLAHAWDMDDLGNIRGTAWGVLTAVSDMVTHRAPLRTTENYEENKFMSLLDRPELMDNAYKAILEMV